MKIIKISNLLRLLFQSMDRLDVVQDVMADGKLLECLFDEAEENGVGRHMAVICCRLKNLIDDEKI